MGNQTMTITSYPTVSFTRIETRENINRSTIENTSKNFGRLQQSMLKITKKPSVDSFNLSKEELEKHQKLFTKKNYINRSKMSLTRAKPVPFNDLEKLYKSLNISELKDPITLYTNLGNYPDKLGLVKTYQTLKTKTNRILSDMFRSIFYPTPFKLNLFNDKVTEQLTLLECLAFSKAKNLNKLLRSSNKNTDKSITFIHNKENKYKEVKTTLDVLTQFDSMGEQFKRVDLEIREERLSIANELALEIDTKLNLLDCNIKLVENLKTKNEQKRTLILSLAEVKFFNYLFLEVGLLLDFNENFVCGATLFDIKELFVYLKRKEKTLQSSKEVSWAAYNNRSTDLLDLIQVNDEYKTDKNLGVVSSFQTIIASNFFDCIISVSELNRYSGTSELEITEEMSIATYLEESNKTSFAVKILSETMGQETILKSHNREINSLLSLEDLIHVDLEKMVKSPDVLIRNFCKTFIFLNISFLFFGGVKENELISHSLIFAIIEKSYNDILNIITIFIDLLHGKKSYILLRLIQIVTCALNDFKDIMSLYKLNFNINEKYEMLSLIFKSFVLSIHVNNICDYKEHLNSNENWNIASIKQVESFTSISDSVEIDMQQISLDKEKKLKLISSLDKLIGHLKFYFEVKKSVGYLKKNMPGCVNTLNNDVDKCLFDFFEPIVKAISSKMDLMDNKSKKQLKTMLIFIKTIDNIVYISGILKLKESFTMIDSMFYKKLSALRDKTRNLIRGIINLDTVKISDQKVAVVNEKKLKIYEKLLNTLLDKEDVLFITSNAV